jgi:hypothetical protein
VSAGVTVRVSVCVRVQSVSVGGGVSTFEKVRDRNSRYTGRRNAYDWKLLLRQQSGSYRTPSAWEAGADKDPQAPTYSDLKRFTADASEYRDSAGATTFKLCYPAHPLSAGVGKWASQRGRCNVWRQTQALGSSAFPVAGFAPISLPFSGAGSGDVWSRFTGLRKRPAASRFAGKSLYGGGGNGEEYATGPDAATLRQLPGSLDFRLADARQGCAADLSGAASMQYAMPATGVEYHGAQALDFDGPGRCFAAARALGLLNEWQRVGSRRGGQAVYFKLFTQKKTWSAASAHCQSVGGSLAYVETQEQATRLVSMLRDYRGDKFMQTAGPEGHAGGRAYGVAVTEGVWLGASDDGMLVSGASEGNWVWKYREGDADGEGGKYALNTDSSYYGSPSWAASNFCTNGGYGCTEPNGGGAQNCLEMQVTGSGEGAPRAPKYVDRGCATENLFFCSRMHQQMDAEGGGVVEHCSVFLFSLFFRGIIGSGFWYRGNVSIRRWTSVLK